MKKFKLHFILLLLASQTFLSHAQTSFNHIDNDKDRWKIFFRQVSPIQNVTSWKLPFQTTNRHDIKTISVVSTFGSPRQSYVKGHFHTGLDIIPRKHNLPFIDVYAMAPGIVCSIHLGDPHRTVVIKHLLSSGHTIYTSYKHLQEIIVKNGQTVTDQTKLGRLYTRQEALAQGGNYDHLHLEIRKKFDDYGTASWATLTREELNLRFEDPLKFLKQQLNPPHSHLIQPNPHTPQVHFHTQLSAHTFSCHRYNHDYAQLILAGNLFKCFF